MFCAGDVTDETAALLSQEGCGVPDVLPDTPRLESGGRHKRSARAGCVATRRDLMSREADPQWSQDAAKQPDERCWQKYSRVGEKQKFCCEISGEGDEVREGFTGFWS